jgi:hypothetical protein
MMTEEALVFTSRHCIDERFGDVLEFDHAALRTVPDRLVTSFGEVP